MKKQVAGGHDYLPANSKSLKSNEATWLPKVAEDNDGNPWPNTAAYERIQNTSIRIAAEEGFEYDRDQRRTAIQDLTRRYFIQIRSGCGNDLCCKPLCFSCQSRVAHGRVRRATVLTARMQSFVLVADNRHNVRLCHGIARLSYHETLDKYLKLIRDDELKGPTKKDSKSLTQSLFDTAAMKLFQGALMPIGCHGHLLSRNAKSVSTDQLNEYGVVHATESAKSQKRSDSKTEPSDASGQKRFGKPNAPLPKNSVAYRAVPGEILKRKQYESTHSSKKSYKTKRKETLSNSQEGSRPLSQHIENEKCLVCQRKTQLCDYEKVLRYMDCQLVDDIKHLLSFERNQNGIENHYKILRFNASESISKRICHSSTAETFLRRSVYHCLGDAEILAKSFRKSSTDAGFPSETSLLNDASYEQLSKSLALLQDLTGSLVFDSLRRCLQSLYIPPPEIILTNTTKVKSQPQLRSGAACTVEVHEDILYSQYMAQRLNSYNGKPHVSDSDAAHIIFICFCALTATWVSDSTGAALGYQNYREFLIDHHGDEPRRRLLHQLIKVIAARRCHWSIQRKISKSQSKQLGVHSFPLVSIFLDQISKVDDIEHISLRLPAGSNTEHERQMSLLSHLNQSLRMEIFDYWDGKDTVGRWSLVGGATELLKDIWLFRSDNPHVSVGGLPIRTFLDPIKTPINFINRKSSPNDFHFLSFNILFDEVTLVQYFRTLNYSIMSKAYESSEYLSFLMNRFVLPTTYRVYLNARLKVAFDRFLTLNVRRDHILEDSFNQLWRREKRELLRPLKVILGSEGGEEGLDQGGVSIEYFRLAVNEALAAAVGMFSIDPISNMAWFQPASLEPLYRYELLGLLFSLAIFNGVTLSINFPTVFYLKLMGETNFTIEQIQDGWPQLAKGLAALLSWKEGDVSEVFMRTYDFSFEAYGQTINLQMKEYDHDQVWPGLQQLPFQQRSQNTSPALSKPSLRVDKSIDDPVQGEGLSHGAYVTNANREDYVKDYVYWLTEKSIQRQYEAFAKGFYTCLNRKAISILTPELFKEVVEGHREINVNILRLVATYEDGYHEEHPLIRGFWQIVREYDEQSQRQLLEFVTASDRIPVNGMQSIPFAIVRNGGDCDRIPSAMTCFGKLLLPEYSSVEKLRDKLKIALENSRGFGSV